MGEADAGRRLREAFSTAALAEQINGGVPVGSSAIAILDAAARGGDATAAAEVEAGVEGGAEMDAGAALAAEAAQEAAPPPAVPEASLEETPAEAAGPTAESASLGEVAMEEALLQAASPEGDASDGSTAGSTVLVETPYEAAGAGAGEADGPAEPATAVLPDGAGIARAELAGGGAGGARLVAEVAAAACEVDETSSIGSSMAVQPSACDPNELVHEMLAQEPEGATPETEPAERGQAAEASPAESVSSPRAEICSPVSPPLITPPPPPALPAPLPASCAELLAELGLGKYRRRFAKEDVLETSMLLAMLALPDGKAEVRAVLADLGMSVGHREKLMLALSGVSREVAPKHSPGGSSRL